MKLRHKLALAANSAVCTVICVRLWQEFSADDVTRLIPCFVGFVLMLQWFAMLAWCEEHS